MCPMPVKVLFRFCQVPILHDVMKSSEKRPERALKSQSYGQLAGFSTYPKNLGTLAGPSAKGDLTAAQRRTVICLERIYPWTLMPWRSSKHIRALGINRENRPEHARLSTKDCTKEFRVDQESISPALRTRGSKTTQLLKLNRRVVLGSAEKDPRHRARFSRWRRACPSPLFRELGF
jgi:hypothetical protein